MTTSKKISLDAAANELGVSKRSVRRLITSGQLKAVRIGNTSLIRIDRDDLASCHASRCAQRKRLMTSRVLMQCTWHDPNPNALCDGATATIPAAATIPPCCPTAGLGRRARRHPDTPTPTRPSARTLRGPQVCRRKVVGRGFCAPHLYPFHRFPDPLAHISIGDLAALKQWRAESGSMKTPGVKAKTTR